MRFAPSISLTNRSRMRLSCAIVLVLLLSLAGFSQQAKHPAPIAVNPPKHSGNSLTIVITDENGVAIPDVVLTVTDQQTGKTLSSHTDAAGRGQFLGLNSAHEFTVRAQKTNYYEVSHADLHATGTQVVEIIVPHVQELKEVVNVTATAAGIDPAQTANTQTLGTAEVINIPYPTSRDIRNILNYIPQVVQDGSGQVHVAGAATYETRDVLDGFDITSPVSGTLSTRFSADAVRAIDVESSRYSTQFGRGSGGLIDFTSGTGDDHLRFDATNFIPSLTSKKGINFDKWVPRATVSGPIVKGKAWFFDSADAEYDENLFKDLPSEADTDPLLRASNLAKVQVNLRPNDILSGELLQNVQDEDREFLSLQNPASTTLQRDISIYMAGLKELHYFSGGATLELGFAENGFRDSYRPQGTDAYFINPNGSSGNYFESFVGHSHRSQGIANLFLKPFNAGGHHELKFGLDLDRVNFDQLFHDRPFSLLRIDGTLLRQSVLPLATQFERNNFETGAYAEDRWSPSDRLLIQPGLRFDWDEIVRRPLFSPRIASTYALGKERNTKLSAGIGVYYDRTHLDYLARALTGPRFDTYFDPTGTVATGPPLETTFSVNQPLLREPRFVNWSLGIEQRLPASIYGSLEFTEKSGTDGFIFQNLNSGNILFGNYLLTNTRRDHYHAVQFTARKHFSGDYNLFGAYTRSYAHSNAVIDYTLVNPIFSPQAGGPLPWDAPNRFLSWGWLPVPLTKRFDIVYALEYRTGFPFTAVNTNQQVVGAPDSLRFPAYFSLDPGLELRFTFRGYALALRGVLENATGRKNPAFVNNNVDSPGFDTFNTFQGRAFTARIRFLGRK